mmetsp:Transcript_34794/g.74026  ORF Transcript_34794/g.74026 Transcript_34794/m.74026 type:complete len:218 (+) Transcript_34794:1072-1725(+)
MRSQRPLSLGMPWCRCPQAWGPRTPPSSQLQLTHPRSSWLTFSPQPKWALPRDRFRPSWTFHQTSNGEYYGRLTQPTRPPPFRRWLNWQRRTVKLFENCCKAVPRSFRPPERNGKDSAQWCPRRPKWSSECLASPNLVATGLRLCTFPRALSGDYPPGPLRMAMMTSAEAERRGCPSYCLGTQLAKMWLARRQMHVSSSEMVPSDSWNFILRPSSRA